MVEAYAFLAIFTIQILAMSVLYPSLFIRYLRRQATLIPDESLAQLYPGVDLGPARKRFLTQYRAVNTDIALGGFLLLVVLFPYLRRPDWHAGKVVAMVTVYFLVQALLPLGLVVWRGGQFSELHRRSLLEGKRKATLQRRRLFDFVSPLMVSLAVLSYFLSAALVIYLQPHPFVGFAGLVNIGALTLVYAVQAFVVYAVLYGKKPNPFETHAARVRTIGLVVKCCVYSCIACAVFLSLSLTLGLRGWQMWEPSALSGFFVITSLLSLMGMTAPSRHPEADGLGSNPAA
jgi:hypothetical protein